MPPLTTPSLLPSTIRLLLIKPYCWLYRLHRHIPYHKAKIPIFFIEVKPLLAYDLDSSRKAVDDQIRKRVSQLYGCKYPHPQTLRNKWAPNSVSTIIVPLCVALSPHSVSTLNPSLLPTGRLRRDGILEPQGEVRLEQVVPHINLEEMGWLPVSHVSLDFLTLQAHRSE